MATYDRPLATFLARLAGSRELLEQYNRSEYDARQLMNGAGLSEVQQNALLSRDVTAIHTQLLAEDPEHQGFIVPSGPVMTAASIGGSLYRDFPFPVMFFQAEPSEPGGGATTMRAAAAPMPTMAARRRKRVSRSAGAKKKTGQRKKTAGSRKSSRSSRKSTSRKK